MEWIEVVDSAVKIGLGALIGGGVTAYQSSVTRKAEAARTLLLRRRELLEAVAQTIDDFTARLADYWAALTNLLIQKAEGLEVAAVDWAQYEKLAANLYSAFPTLNTAESRLLLLGHSAAQEALRDYSRAVEKFFTNSNFRTTTFTEAELKDLYGQFREQRRALLLLLSDIYSEPSARGGKAIRSAASRLGSFIFPP
jgi:hypothetical protein